MIEDIAVVGLTCNVLQVISFAHESLLVIEHIAKDRNPEPLLAGNAAHLGKLSKDLQKSLDESTDMQTSSTNQNFSDLYKAALKCQEITSMIDSELKKISRSREKSLGVARAAAKSWWKSSELKRLKDDMKGIQDIVNISLVNDMR
jgi:hypothetical protein